MKKNKKKILIVDDDEATREIYLNAFKERNFEVLEARDGLEGLEIALKEIPDIVFTGIVMPRMDGWGLMRSLKEHTKTAKIPVVISSHLGREEDRRNAEALGAKDFIIRALVRPSEVVDRIKVHLGERITYLLAIDEKLYDAPKMIQDFYQGASFKCKKCGGHLILSLTSESSKEGYFKVNFVCPKCSRI